MNAFAAKHVGGSIDGAGLVVSTGSIYVYGVIITNFAGGSSILFQDNDGNTYIELEVETITKTRVLSTGWLADNGLIVTGAAGAAAAVFHSQDGA